MDRYLTSEKAVLKKLHASSFRNISKKQIMTFVSNYDKMDKEVALRCIEQFPSFANFINTAFSELNMEITDILRSNDRVTESEIEIIRTRMTYIKDELDKPYYSPEQHLVLLDKLSDCQKDLHEIDKRNKNFMLTLVGGFAATLGTAVVALAAVLGQSSQSSQPFINSDDDCIQDASYSDVSEDIDE